jgi:lipopolysaccharide biosynthesis regulator YciM
MITLWPLLLPAAAYSGWVGAMRQSRSKVKHQENHLSREYVVGLNYLLNEQPDKAVDVFIKLLDVDSDTVETHLALGSLFRRRGEVDRAIRIHQNIIARPQLSVAERREALLALGQDYMSAGMFDRAERIFLEVVEICAGTEISSLQGLLDIYQQEKAWEQALEVIKKLEVSIGESMNWKAAHYYCEIAQRSSKNKAYDAAQYAIKQALAVDKDSVRASIMQAELDIQAGRYRQAIRALKRVPEQDPAFLSEIIEPLVHCYHESDAMDECVDYLLEALETHPRSSIIFVIAEYSRESVEL